MGRDQKNKHSHVNCVISYVFMGLEHEKKEDVMKFINAALGLNSKNEEYYPK